MVITPAIMNLAPASMILDAVSSGPILNNSYAILMAGEALPHSTQQKTAVRSVTGNHAQITPLFLSLIDVSLAVISFLFSKHVFLIAFRLKVHRRPPPGGKRRRCADHLFRNSVEMGNSK